MTICCLHCQGAVPVKSSLATAFAGKVLAFACPHCQQLIRYRPEKDLHEQDRAAVPDYPTDPVRSRSATHSLVVKAYLEVVPSDFTTGQRLPLRPGVNRIGRRVDPPVTPQPECVLATQDRSVSKRHCQLEWLQPTGRADRFLLRDAGSTNGTYLSDDSELLPGEAVYLSPDQTFRLGRTVLVLRVRQQAGQESD